MGIDTDKAARLFDDGLAHHRAGRFIQAGACYQEALDLDPGHVGAWHLSGVIAAQLGQPDQAVARYRQALHLEPEAPDVLNNLGVVLQKQGQIEAAMTQYRQALVFNPQSQQALNNLGVASMKLGRLEPAILYYQEAIRIQPDYIEALNNLANALLGLDRRDEAIDLYQQCLKLQPNHPQVLNNLGSAFHEQGRPGEAIECFKQALRLKPNDPDAHNNLGVALLEHGHPNEAIGSYRNALILKPDYAEAHTNIIFAQNFIPGNRTEDQQQERSAWNTAHAQKLRRCLKPEESQNPSPTLRIGYVSASFRRQAATYAFAPVLLHHDYTHFQVVCYSDTVREDDLSTLLKGQTGIQWRSTVGLSDDRMAALIREDAIDILVDCVGHMRGNRLLVFARKPAPIQITAWGEPTGTGLLAMDYLFADPVLIPVNERGSFAETIIDLPCFLTYWTPDPLPEPDTSTPPESFRIRFGSFNRAAKITDASLELWARVLAAVPGASLLLKDRVWRFPAQQAALRERFTRCGGDPTRLEFLGETTRTQHFEAYRTIDIALDPTPHGGGMTTLDALWMGVPVVTLQGSFPSSRLAAAVLVALDIPEWCANSPDQYVARAAQLAANIEDLRNWRRTLRHRMQSTAVANPEKYTRRIESVYRDLHNEHRARSEGGQRPEDHHR